MLIQKYLSKSQTYKPLQQPTVHLRVFSWWPAHPVALKSIAKVPNQKVARQPKCFSSSDGLVQICMTFTMVFTQNSSVFHWAVHQPIAFIQVWSLTRWFEPLTKQLWLPLRRHFFFTCTRAHKSLSNDIMQNCWIRTQLVCRECLKKAWSGQLFFSQYCIGSLWVEICYSVIVANFSSSIHHSAAKKKWHEQE